VRITYTLGEALEVVLGFAFGLQVPGSPYSEENPRLFAYRSYDCALRSPATQVCEEDVFASIGLNSGIKAEVILKVLAVIDNETDLPDLATVPDFWLLDPKRLLSDPGVGHPEHALWWWYKLLTSNDGVGGAVASKIVHHRHPTVMPLWDSVVGRAYHVGDTWAEIHADLNGNGEWFAELERRFSLYLAHHENGFGVELARLRLLDILVWADRAGHRSNLGRLGKTLLVGVDDPDTW
jgi:hypothetical protein